MGFSARELRDAYPHMLFSQFVEIYELHRNNPDLLDYLDAAEKKAVLAKEAAEEKLKKLYEEISASEQHRKLNIVVPADFDLEHVQAVLMYGFLMPGKTVVFLGKHLLPESHVRTNVENKLGFNFSQKKLDMALSYLKKEGIFNRRSAESGRGEGLSLKTSWKEKGIGTHGAQILRVALEFAREKERR